MRHGTIYILRHTFASNALAAGISLFDLSRFMGTSIEMINRTYGHLAEGSEQAARAKLDAMGGLGVQRTPLEPAKRPDARLHNALRT
jgi:integrase